MSQKTRTIFFGTPEFAVPTLEVLADKTDLIAVITQPDRQSGRGRKVIHSPVKARAIDLGLEIVQPEIVKGRRFASKIASYEPDFIVTAAFGKILGQSLLDVPKKACLNVHASILPKHRGAAPVNWTILCGDQSAGVSIMQMTLGLDTGPVFAVKETPIEPEETAGELLARISHVGAQAAWETIQNFDRLTASPQDDEKATWAPMLKKTDGNIDWTKTAIELHRHIRGLHPWPCAATSIDGEPLKIHTCRVASETGKQGPPGSVLDATGEGLDIACGSGILRLIEVQAAGRRRLHVKDFLKGAKITSDVVLGN